MVSEGCHDHIDKQIQDYTIIKKLADGGSAYVYLARNSFGEFVAIKLLKAKYLKTAIHQNFLQEVQILQELKHFPNIISILDHSECEGLPYIILEYASGGTLRARMNASSPIRIDEALAILAQVGEALYAMHLQNFVHNDLKPENILFDKQNNARLADFGLALKLGTPDESRYVPWGTYAYMAPEQFDGKFTHKGDQYSLGCVAYELLSGKHPFESYLPFNPSDRDMMRDRHSTFEPHPLLSFGCEGSTYLDLAILKSMAKRPSERHVSIHDFVQSLQSFVSSPFQSLHRRVQTIHTPPLYPSVLEEVRSPTDPCGNSNASSPCPEECELVYVDVSSHQSPPESYHSRLSHQQFPVNSDKGQPKQTDYPSSIQGSVPQRVKETSPPEIGDPEEVLLDLHLPDKFRDLLSPLFQRLGFELTECEVRDEYASSIQRRYTKVMNKTGLGRALLYIPDYILDEASSKNMSALSHLSSSFPKHSVLILFSDISENPAREIRNILNKQWPDQREISVIFVPWRDVKEISKCSIEEQDIWITEDLQFQGLIESGGEVISVQNMDGNDKIALVGIIEKLPQLIDNPGKGGRLLLEAAGLAMVTSEFGFQGDSSAVAWELIKRLQVRARLSGRKSECEVLGWLLIHILSCKEISHDEEKAICKILRKYMLIPSTWDIG